MPRKKTLNKHLTSKLQVSPDFTLDSVADSNYRGKCDVGGFLIFEWTLLSQGILNKSESIESTFLHFQQETVVMITA
jgi:hypothetical protein